MTSDHLGSSCIRDRPDACRAGATYEEYRPYASCAQRAAQPELGFDPKRSHFCGKERGQEAGLDHVGARYNAGWPVERVVAGTSDDAIRAALEPKIMEGSVVFVTRNFMDFRGMRLVRVGTELPLDQQARVTHKMVYYTTNYPGFWKQFVKAPASPLNKGHWRALYKTARGDQRDMRKITCIPAVNGGAPTIDGTRLSCANVSLLLEQAQIALMLAVHPYLARDDIEHALRYCAQRECLADRPTNYCGGCSLDRRPRDADEPAPIDVWEVSGRLLSGGGGA